ncbi:MAG: Gfo/Idh/MocA family oxidoreductase [Planctomycetaceae bacterium]|jgi:predicted dehydrogenase|nr:Gfo/Idh/MocA family oxidoreductase [Planctomycetaceae bacterium]
MKTNLSPKKSKISKTSRRQFIRAGIGVATTMFATPFILGDESKGANDKIGIALIGAGGMGGGDIKNAARFGNVVAIADVDLQQAKEKKTAFNNKPTIYQDYRKLLENKDVDVVIQATPDHWHTKINVDSLLAGKDVYGEKPLALTINEGQILRKTIKDTNRIFQTGTQQRSDTRFQTVIELVRNGRIGKLQRVLVALPYFNASGGPFPAVDKIPDELDWDMYQGQAQVCPYIPQRTRLIFRWWYEYAGGIVTDWGNHHFDIAQWGMDTENTGPLTVEARGIFPNDGKPDCFNTPDRFYSEMKYANGVDVFFYTTIKEKPKFHDITSHQETTLEQISWLFGKNCPQDVHDNGRNGIMFIGDKGRVFVNRGGAYGKPLDELKENPLPSDAWRTKPSKDHMKNFFDCVRSRETPVASAELEHRSITPCHLTNISIRLGGRKLQWDPVKEEITNDKEANEMLKREQRKPYQI